LHKHKHEPSSFDDPSLLSDFEASEDDELLSDFELLELELDELLLLLLLLDDEDDWLLDFVWPNSVFLVILELSDLDESDLLDSALD